MAIIIGLTGENCAGKGTVADYLVQKGFYYYSLSDTIREELANEGKNSLQLDCKAPTQSFAETALTENRFKQLLKLNPNATEMLQTAEKKFRENFEMLQNLASMTKS